jgi:NAD(P)-dependent dehydrogenase (short-subunit alcohol dehydrogenase family)
MAGTLEDKVALVTGAGSGIGRAIALRFASEGARVVVSDIDQTGGERTAGQIRERRGNATFVRSDTSEPEQCAALVNACIRQYGSLHVAINNAGIGGPSAPVGQYPLAGWDSVIAVNLSGVFYSMRHQIPALVESGGGAIVNIASVLGQVGFRNAAAYVAAKHGVVGLTQTAAIEYAAQNVRINVVGPGFIKTPLLDRNLTEDALRDIAAMHPIGRLGEPDEVAELVLWLSSDRATFVTGAYYPIDGGYLAQ